MYIQGSRQNKFHVERYGHPSKFGSMELDNLWNSEKWEPEALVLLGSQGALTFVRDANRLAVNLRAQKPHDYAYAMKITPA